VSGLSDSHNLLKTVIEDGGESGIRVFDAPSGTFATPCVRVHPASPWLAPSSLARGRRTQRWEVWIVVGKMDSKATFAKMEDMVSIVTNILDRLDGWSAIVWERPAPTDMGGTLYLAVRGIIETVNAV